MTDDEPNEDRAGNLALVLLRHEKRLSQEEFARLARIAPSQLSAYDRGARPIPRRLLERAAKAVDFPPFLLDPLLREIRSFLAAARGWSSTRGALLGTAFAGILELAGWAFETILGNPGDRSPSVENHPPSAEDRAVADALWPRLEKLSAKQRLAVVEELEEYQSWALCERVAAASIEMAASRPAEALTLALLSQRIAELVSGPEPWRRRLRGYAGVHVSNALRVNADLPAADVALIGARELWDGVASGSPGVLNEAIFPWLEATLRKVQRRFPEALRWIDQALELELGALRGRLLLAKAQILEFLGDLEASTAVLREAVPWIDREREPRTAFGLEFQLHVNLCLEGRAAAAEPGLPRVRELGERLGQELDLARVVWIEGKVAAGVGRTAEAEAAFTQVKKVFTAHKLALNAALVNLDLALLFLEQCRTAEVKRLAESMAWIFAGQGVEREALAALRLFCDAARREAASVELAKGLVRYLQRAQHDPELRFEESSRRAGPSAQS